MGKYKINNRYINLLIFNTPPLLQSTGTVSTVHYHIPINKETGEFVHEQHIPFRLTPNMITLMGPIALSGPMVFSMIAAARCLIDPKLGQS